MVYIEWMLSNANVIVNAKESLASEADTMTFIRMDDHTTSRTSAAVLENHYENVLNVLMLLPLGHVKLLQYICIAK